MNIDDHAKNYAQIFKDEKEREIAYSAFFQGARFMQSEAYFSYCKACGVSERLAKPNDCKKTCLMFEKFRKELKGE